MNNKHELELSCHIATVGLALKNMDRNYEPTNKPRIAPGAHIIRANRTELWEYQ